MPERRCRGARFRGFCSGPTHLNFEGIGSEDFEEVSIVSAGVQLFAAKASLFEFVF